MQIKFQHFIPNAALAFSISLTSCGIHPDAWKPPLKPAFDGTTALNEKLVTAEKLSLGGWFGPEDIIFDKAGNLYSGVHAKNDFGFGR